MNIILTGFMCTGKSEVGRFLARKLGWSFYDTDELIEKEAGMTISRIFALKGEDVFRRMEAETVKRLSVLDKSVIATGGGVPLSSANMDALEGNGVVFCLSASPGVILDRVGDVSTRPLLSKGDPAVIIRDLLRLRDKAYKRCKFPIDTDTLSAEEVAERILGLLPGISR